MVFPDDYINKVIQGDCLEVMKQIPDKSIDFVYADPPFNAKLGIGKYSRKYEIGLETRTDMEYKKFCKQWFRQGKRISRGMVITPGIKWIWNYPRAKWIVIVRKPSGIAYSSLGGFNVYEPLVVYTPPLKRLTRDEVLFDAQNFTRGIKNEHPCPDNINMVKWILEYWTRENDLVLDPFLGSGTLAVACKEMGRRFIGIEISEKYCKIARDRLAQEILF